MPSCTGIHTRRPSPARLIHPNGGRRTSWLLCLRGCRVPVRRRQKSAMGGQFSRWTKHEPRRCPCFLCGTAFELSQYYINSIYRVVKNTLQHIGWAGLALNSTTLQWHHRYNAVLCAHGEVPSTTDSRGCAYSASCPILSPVWELPGRAPLTAPGRSTPRQGVGTVQNAQARLLKYKYLYHGGI